MYENNEINLRPLLSIVVPTKNRYNCLKKLIDLFKLYDSPNVELVISDNSDDNTEFIEWLKINGNKRIKYIYTFEWLSVCANADKGIIASKGEYVSLIGDDDGYQPQIVELTKFLKQNEGDSLNGYRCQYLWPGIKSKLFNYDSSLIIRKHCNDKMSCIDVEKELAKILSRGACVSYGKLPCVYNGIVSREILNRIFDLTGTFFPGPSPDMSNSVALATIIKKHFWIEYPFSWAGKNFNSASGMGLMHKHKKKIDQATWLPQDSVKNWDKRIPFYWTASTVWGDSAVEALRRMHHTELIDKFNFGFLYGRYLALNIDQWSSLKNLISARMIFSFVYAFIECWGQRAKIFIRNFILNKCGQSLSFRKEERIANIIECAKYIKNNYPMDRITWRN